jgi:hypothetical protein
MELYMDLDHEMEWIEVGIAYITWIGNSLDLRFYIYLHIKMEGNWSWTWI